MSAKHQAARGVAVESMRQRRRPRQPEAQQREPVLEMRPAARPGMDRNPGRLIDDADKPVAIQHPFGELVGGEVTGVRTPSWKPLPVLRSCMRPPAPVAGEGWG